MRVLLEQECAAVAGGHKSACERGAMKAFSVAGAVAGAAVGNLPGAIAGFAAGATFAEVFAYDLCGMDDHEDEGGEDEDHEIDPDVLQYFEQQFVNWWLRTIGSDITGPHQLVVDQTV